MTNSRDRHAEQRRVDRRRELQGRDNRRRGMYQGERRATGQYLQYVLIALLALSIVIIFFQNVILPVLQSPALKTLGK